MSILDIPDQPTVRVTKAWFFHMLDYMYDQWVDVNDLEIRKNDESKEDFVKSGLWAGALYTQQMKTWVEEWIQEKD